MKRTWWSFWFSAPRLRSSADVRPSGAPGDGTCAPRRSRTPPLLGVSIDAAGVRVSPRDKHAGAGPRHHPRRARPAGSREPKPLLDGGRAVSRPPVAPRRCAPPRRTGTARAPPKRLARPLERPPRPLREAHPGARACDAPRTRPSRPTISTADVASSSTCATPPRRTPAARRGSRTPTTASTSTDTRRTSPSSPRRSPRSSPPTASRASRLSSRSDPSTPCPSSRASTTSETCSPSADPPRRSASAASGSSPTPVSLSNSPVEHPAVRSSGRTSSSGDPPPRRWRMRKPAATVSSSPSSRADTRSSTTTGPSPRLSSLGTNAKACRTKPKRWLTVVSTCP